MVRTRKALQTEITNMLFRLTIHSQIQSQTKWRKIFIDLVTSVCNAHSWLLCSLQIQPEHLFG